jgi:hypothetical protein
MIFVVFVVVVLIGIPALIYLSEWRRRRRTQAELDDDAVRVARGERDGPGEHEPVTLPQRPGPMPPSGL